MAYAFENTPYYLIPTSEQCAIATMQAQIRDNALTLAELTAKYEAIYEKRHTAEGEKV